ITCGGQTRCTTPWLRSTVRLLPLTVATVRHHDRPDAWFIAACSAAFHEYRATERRSHSVLRDFHHRDAWNHLLGCSAHSNDRRLLRCRPHCHRRTEWTRPRRRLHECRFLPWHCRSGGNVRL